MRELLERTFEHEFNETNYKDLISNLFNGFDFSDEHSLKEEFNEAEKAHLKDFVYLGTTKKKNLDVLKVELKGDSKVERARSLQRNLIGKHLRQYNKDAALVAFYSKARPDWRLSYVKMDYKFSDKGVKVEVGTPPKRYSFLVGRNEPSHTAKKQFLHLLDDTVVPSINDIEEIFNIEKVTKEFYIEIARMFTKLVGGERKDGIRKTAFPTLIRYPKKSEKERKEFVVKLLGRILFCWFMKKKHSDNYGPLLPDEILSSKAIKDYPDYYHSLLEPLFFQVLNTPQDKRWQGLDNPYFKSIPFLNGGLFESHELDYCEIRNNGELKPLYALKIPDKWFFELFEIFELYNFTIDESTTIDVDISVDPEMLGRIFENLLAEINPETGETARKSTGSYYTPRPIVDYMVDESLKQYLKNQTGIDEDKLLDLLSFAEDGKKYSEAEIDAIIDALDRVKIIDPACGSGAFPMGILHKMLLILQKIDRKAKKWLERKIKDVTLRKIIEKKLKDEQWDYFRKLGIIRDSIYGVDVQPVAVEISKLRFFLSLVVDEKVNDDYDDNRGVEALPNLEFKFVAANSLIGLPEVKRETTIDFLSEADHKVADLKRLRGEYFTSSGEEKRRIEREFLELQRQMLEDVIHWQKKIRKSEESQALKLSQWNPFSDEASLWFDPEWMFGVDNPSPSLGSVRGAGGFDIVIANPPYVRHESIKAFKPQLAKEFNGFYCGTADLYTYFYKKGIDLLRNGGHLCFIAPNKFMRAGYGKNTRKLLATEVTPQIVIDFCDLPIFDATTYPSVLLVEKRKPGEEDIALAATFTSEEQLDRVEETLLSIGFTMPVASLRPEGWNLERPEVLALIEKLRKAGKPLGEYVHGRFFRGITTGLNEAFVIDTATRDKMIAEDPSSADVIKPWLRGRDIRKWKSHWAGLYFLYIPWHFDIKKYPAISKHLKLFKTKLENRNAAEKDRYEWYALQRYAADYYKDFEKNKIIYPDISQHPKFTWDESKAFLGNTAYIIPTDEVWLVGLLNSKLLWWFYIHLSSAIRGGFVRYIGQYMKQIPIPSTTDKQKAPIIERVDKILANPDGAKAPRLEAEIDKLVYDLYSLTPEEIAIVEGKG